MWIARTGIIASSMSSYDIDALAFITAATITDSTQKSALNQFVLDVKAANIWNKFRAIYPFVGGTASQHRYNLKAPTTSDSDFYITFGGGVSHSSNGVQFNGSTGYADTKINANATNFDYTSMHACIYSRTNSDGAYYDMGVQTNSNFRFLEFDIREGNTFYGTEIHLGTNYLTYTNTDSRGCYILNRPNNSTINLFKDSTKVQTTAQNSTNTIFSNIPIWIGALNRTYASPTGYSNREYAFASIGDGLTDAESLAFYNAVQAYQTTLNRQVGVPIVSDTDAQAFLNAAVITDLGQANAINTLVTDLKSASIWSKMKAVYPFVGGTATTHKWNLKDPRDLDVAFRLVFSGGWTHDSGGALPNGTNAYANSYLTPSSSFNTTTFDHLSYYSRTDDTPSNYPYEIGSYGVGANCLRVRRAGNSGLFASEYPSGTSYGDVLSSSISSGLGLFIGSQTGTNIKMYRNSTIIASNTTATLSTSQSTYPIYLATLNGSDVLTANRWSAKQCAFATIGEGLSDSEVIDFYNAVNTFQIALSRNV